MCALGTECTSMPHKYGCNCIMGKSVTNENSVAIISLEYALLLCTWPPKMISASMNNARKFNINLF